MLFWKGPMPKCAPRSAVDVDLIAPATPFSTSPFIFSSATLVVFFDILLPQTKPTNVKTFAFSLHSLLLVLIQAWNDARFHQSDGNVIKKQISFLPKFSQEALNHLQTIQFLLMGQKLKNPSRAHFSKP